MLCKWRVASIWILLIVVPLLLSGCAKGTAHVTVKTNGSVDVAIDLRLDSRTQSLASGRMNDLITRLQAAGIQLQKSQEGSTTHYQFVKTYASVQEIRSLMSHSKSEFIDANVKTTDKWLYSKVEVETQLHLSSYADRIIQEIGTTNIPKPLIRLLMQGFSFDFSLTLPFNVYGANNAAVQDGKTLTWPITLSDSDPILMTIYVPNLRNIGIAAGGGVLILGGIICFVIRRRRLRG